MKYEIWSEGFAITGNQAWAYFEGVSEGSSFEDAVIKKIGDRLDKDPNEKDGFRRMGGYLSVWGCRIFDNELDARKNFG